MEYELAKQLKDAGFPQKYIRGQTMYDPSVEPDKDGIIPNDTEEVFIPTLSELIDACGDKFGSLVRQEPHPAYYKFGFTAYPSQWQLIDEGIGKTPEEAVANLWLALNKE